MGRGKDQAGNSVNHHTCFADAVVQADKKISCLPPFMHRPAYGSLLLTQHACRAVSREDWFFPTRLHRPAQRNMLLKRRAGRAVSRGRLALPYSITILGNCCRIAGRGDNEITGKTETNFHLFIAGYSHGPASRVCGVSGL